MTKLISYSNPCEALPKQFKHYFNNLKVGMCMSMTGSPTLKCGCGKSLTSVGIASMLDPYFTIDKVGLFPSEFLGGIDSFSEHTYGDNVIPGQCVIMDEGEITAPSSLWFSFTNRAIFYTLATFRNTRGLAIIITPSLKWIDSRMRTLLGFWGYTDKEYSAGTTHVSMRLFRISTDMLGEKIYFRKLRMWDKINKRITIFKEFNIKRPDPELEAEYEEKSGKFKAALRKDLMGDVAKFERMSSYRADGETIQLEDLAKKVIDDEALRNTLFGGRAISTALLRTIMEREGAPLKLGEAELLKKIIMKMWKGKKAED